MTFACPVYRAPCCGIGLPCRWKAQSYRVLQRRLGCRRSERRQDGARGRQAHPGRRRWPGAFRHSRRQEPRWTFQRGGQDCRAYPGIIALIRTNRTKKPSPQISEWGDGFFRISFKRARRSTPPMLLIPWYSWDWGEKRVFGRCTQTSLLFITHNSPFNNGTQMTPMRQIFEL